MTGFLSVSGWQSVDLRRGLPPGLDRPPERLVLADGEIIFWGSPSGDVHLAAETQTALLVLSGYICEIKGESDFATQQEACDYILRTISRCSSLTALSTFTDRLVGSFALLHRDLRSKTTTCITDRVGSRPLWIGWRDQSLVVSTHAMAVARTVGVRQFSPVGAGAFLLYGGPIDPSHSIFQDVSALPGGSIRRIFRDGKSESYTWATFRHEPDNRLSQGEWIKDVSEQLVTVAARTVKGCRRPAVFFSGGTDSRLLAAALKAAGKDPVLLTLSDGPNLETRVAMAAGRALQLEHHIIKRDEYWYLRTLQRSVYETSGIYTWTHGHFAAAAQQAMAQFEVDAFLLGDLCEAFSKLFCDGDKVPPAVWTTSEFVRSHDAIRLPLYRPERKEEILSLFNPKIRSEVGQSIEAQIARRFELVRGRADDPLIIGDLAFRWESVGLLPTFFMFLDLRSAAAERNLMFDPEIHALLQRLPARMRSGCNLGAQLIRRLAPRAAWVVNSNSLVPMCWPPVLHKSARRLKPWFGKMRRAIIGASHRTTGSWQERAQLYLSDVHWRGAVELAQRQVENLSPELFDLESVRNAFLKFFQGDLRRSGEIEKLLQLGLLNELLRNEQVDGPMESRESCLPRVVPS
jgi:hypothetical protein